MREEVAFVVAGVFAGCLVAVVLHHPVSTNKIKNPHLSSDLPPPPLPQPSPSRRQDLGSSVSYPPTPASASSPDQAASTRSDLANKQLHYIKRWFDELVPPWILTGSFFNRRRRLSNHLSVARCAPSTLRRSVFNRCLARSPIWLYAPLVPLRLFDGELVARRRCVAVFIWSKDLYVILSSSEDFCVKTGCLI
jgi:hypothetical protein